MDGTMIGKRFFPVNGESVSRTAHLLGLTEGTPGCKILGRKFMTKEGAKPAPHGDEENRA
jgi:hypothetical protein